jgi:hypothetical protein
MAAIIIGEVCPYCSKFRSPLDIIPMQGGAKICTQCEQRHLEALQVLSTGRFTGECSECGRTPDELANRPMAVHFENGVYRMMCLPCDAAYTPKRRDLYGKTEFGHNLKLN